METKNEKQKTRNGENDPIILILAIRFTKNMLLYRKSLQVFGLYAKIFRL